MNLQILLPVISKAVGRDLTPEVNLFFRARAAVGKSLTPEGQKFFMENWPKIVDFMETTKGQEALSVFLNEWGKAMVPVITAPPVKPPDLPPSEPGKEDVPRIIL